MPQRRFAPTAVVFASNCCRSSVGFAVGFRRNTHAGPGAIDCREFEQGVGKITWPCRATPEDERATLDCRMIAL